MPTVESRQVSQRSLKMFAALIGVKVDELLICRDLINEGKAYYEWETPKAQGGMRKITSPCEELKAVQRHILDRILYGIPIHLIAHGFVRDKDIFTNAAEHNQARTVFNIDLKDAFPSVRTHRIMVNLKKPVQKLLRLNYSNRIVQDEIDDILWLLVKLCTFRDCLPQGTPTSPALLNIVCLNLDRELFTLAMEHDLKVTRYADDITFSTEADEIPGEVRQAIRSTVSRTGWKLNKKKTKHLTRATGNALEVTGLLLMENGKFSIPPERRAHYRDFLRAITEQEELDADTRARAVGIIVYVSRAYKGRLPSAIRKAWGLLKAKHGFKDAPNAKHRRSVDQYQPDIIWQGE